MRESELLPPAVFAYSEARKFETVLKAAKDFQSEEEYVYYLTHLVNNITHNNGRIYMHIDENDNLYANSVSPYAKDFLKNIEPKILPLVNLFTKKRYLTYSSCEGHGLTFRRYVGLAFADEKSRQYVIDYVKNLNIAGVGIKTMNSVCNQEADLSSKRNVRYGGKYSPEEREQKESEIKTFNIQFHRNYEEYFFLEIYILEAINVMTLKNPFKAIWLYWMKKHYWDKLTQRLVDGLNSDKFKKYRF